MERCAYLTMFCRNLGYLPNDGNNQSAEPAHRLAVVCTAVSFRCGLSRNLLFSRLSCSRLNAICVRFLGLLSDLLAAVHNLCSFHLALACARDVPHAFGCVGFPPYFSFLLVEPIHSVQHVWNVTRCPGFHVYEVRPRKDHRGFDLISDALPFGRLWYTEPNAIINAIDYAKFRSRSHKVLIRVFDESGTVIETHEHAGDFREP